MSDDELDDLNNRIEELTEDVMDSLGNSGTLWFPLLVHSMANVMRVVSKASESTSHPVEVDKVTDTFCRELVRETKYNGLLRLTELDLN